MTFPLSLHLSLPSPSFPPLSPLSLFPTRGCTHAAAVSEQRTSRAGGWRELAAGGRASKPASGWWAGCTSAQAGERVAAPAEAAASVVVVDGEGHATGALGDVGAEAVGVGGCSLHCRHLHRSIHF
uniref:Uncharacterized protein n=1 Tax=Oryza sativa subsp. japonica TaxID=39947 RepID=Q5Z5H6_ORYSJ|nr:hypothetical protein [Oryza sativa Japonica Group]